MRLLGHNACYLLLAGPPERMCQAIIRVRFCTTVSISTCDSAGKESACSVGDWVRSLGWDPLEKGKATHSSILAWRIPWTVESIGSQRVRHDWATFTSLHPSLHISTKALEFASQSLVVIYDCCLICFFEYSELECFSIWLSHCFFTLSFPLAFLSWLWSSHKNM